MNYKKFSAAASTALMIVIVIALMLAPGAGAKQVQNTIQVHGRERRSRTLCWPDLRLSRKSLRHDRRRRHLRLWYRLQAGA